MFFVIFAVSADTAKITKKRPYGYNNDILRLRIRVDKSILQKAIYGHYTIPIRLCILGIVVIVIVLGFNARFFYNAFQGPLPITLADLEAIHSASEPYRYWFEVSGQSLVNTGLKYHRSSSRGLGPSESSYFVLTINNRFLLVKIDGTQQDKTLPPHLTGWLEEFSPEEQAKVIPQLESITPTMKGRFLPRLFHTGNLQLIAAAGLASVGIAIGLFVWVLILSARNPTFHSFNKTEIW